MTRTVKADELAKLISTDRDKIASAFREIEQIQSDYQGAYTRFRAEHDLALQALETQVKAQGERLPAELAGQIATRAAVERQGIDKRRAELENTLIPGAQKAADDLLARAQRETADLAQLNPQLNAQEETAKAARADSQKKLDDLNAQVSRLAGGLGFVLHAGKIQELDRERYRTVGQLQALDKQLSDVRKQWLDRSTALNKDETGLRAEWEKTTAQLGDLRAERDRLAADPDDIARSRAIFWVLDNVKSPMPASDASLDAGLEHMIELNVATDAFTQALGSIAGILGVAKGVDEGLTRLGQSVAALIDEQNRHSEFLQPLKFSVPDGVDAFAATWDDLAAKAKDETKFANHPADFYAAVKPFLEQRLTNDQIASFFNALSASVQAATKSWRSG